ncbi:hypothetical protein CY34DRAFT_23366 [Suillus luteus UH-Slu-Lm8-n1]|uniref:Uncharacterized protein n=1 Tax=Suillus luteus UH-Slu-Lm8-n1 TaxID=930992 RepID=A0A0D0BKT6_9AGAM|nr:hypothetical protein CY34DRAFT_23366 [Suillus luteus UH-Slu-Lm8-n1]
MNHHSNTVTKFHLPLMKMAPKEGEDMFWAVQDGPMDLKAALMNHLRVNPADSSAHLFAWKHPNRLFIAASLPDLKGHSLRIRGTLEYLLQGVPFDIVKSMGRWFSDTFIIYLINHTVILAPYIQALPALKPFTCYTLPPVC